MLIQFVVENYRSFRDKAVLSMRASERRYEQAGQLYTTAGGERVLRAAVTYGANASGKSNLIKALTFVRDLVLEGTSAKKRISHQPFKLDPPCWNRPSRFELAFVHEDFVYSYGFAVDATHVHAEWLFRGTDVGEELLFQRELDDAGKGYAFELGQALVADEQRRQFYGFIHEGTRTNQLFLREAEERNATELAPVLDWFRNRVRIVLPDSTDRELAYELDRNTELRQALGMLLQGADTGISGIEVKRSQVGRAQADGAIMLPSSLDDWTISRLNEHFSTPPSYPSYFSVTADGTLERLRIITRHGTNNEAVDFELDEESDGTRRLMNLASVIHAVDTAAPSVYILDELDRSLHPLVTRFFVREFLSKSAPQRQLICTTHDTNLLDLDLLTPEAIWFVEKDLHGASHLYSLDEFDAAQLEALRDHRQEGYLAGRFGAIPFLGDKRRLLPDPTPSESSDAD